MAHPYSTEARLKRLLAGKGERLLGLLDRNRDGVADTDGTTAVIDDTLARVDNDIDARLGQVYVVPFAATVPGQVSDLSDLGAAAELYDWLDPESGEAARFRERYLNLIDEYRRGLAEIPGAAKVDSADGGRSWAFESMGPRFGGRDSSGRNDGVYTDDTTDPTDGM